MKKRIFSLLLAVSLVLGMLVMPAGAAVAGQTYETCPHCGVAWEQVNWQALLVEEPTKTIPSGHYYLEEDLNAVDRYKIGTSDGQTADLAVDICLDLRGHKMTQTGSGDRAFYVYDYSRFDILDSVGGGEVVGNCKSIGGTIYVCKDANFYLHSGTVSNPLKNRTGHGGVINGSTGSNIHIYGGIVDASAVTFDEDMSGTLPRGGAIYTGGLLEITDGLILGGYMNQGGAISITSAGTMRMSGGIVAGGTAKNTGGNINSFGDVYISGGQILGGYASGQGGNVFSSYNDNGLIADLYISGGYIADGTAGSNGGNVTVAKGTCEVSGGTIKGNFYTNIAMTVTGNPVINHYDYEGMQSSKLVTFKDLTEGASILLMGGSDEVTVANTTTSPDLETYLEKGYIKEASRYNLALTDGNLVSTLDNTGYCPHCKTEITWVPYAADINTSGHYYVGESVTVTAADAAATIAKDADIVINLSNGSVKSEVPYQVAGKLSLLCTATSYASFSNTAETTENGGSINLTGTLNIYDGVLRGTTTTGKGGAVYAVDGSVINIYGGRIEGGKAASGGAINYDAADTSSKHKINMNGGVILGGTATGSGGNVTLTRATFTMNGGIISGGAADVNGGNLNSSSSGTFTINGGLIYGGYAKELGGNGYAASTASKYNLNGGIVYGGNVGKSGGNFYLNNGTHKICGGSVLNGVAKTNGGNIYNNAGSYYTKDTSNPKDPTKNYLLVGDNKTTDTNPAPVVSGGRATVGGNIYLASCLQLGKANIVGGVASSNADTLFVGNKAYITVKSGFESKLVAYLNSTRIKELQTNRYLSNTTVEDGAAGEIYAENYEMARLLYGQNGLQLGGASVVDAAGKQAWYLSAQEALQACGQDAYVKLYAPDNTLQIDTAAVVDLNGTNLTVTGSGKLYGFDSENDDYNGCGTATLGEASAEPVFLAPNGYRYVALTKDGKTSFHRMGITIANVSLRPSIAGIYFQGTWSCDDMLAKEIDTYGVAVSLEDMPGADFATDSDTLHTSFDQSTFTNGQPQTSVMIQNIIKTNAHNASRGTSAIYAAPYVALKSGAVIVGDDNKTDGGVAYSLADVLQSVNRIWPRLTDSQKASVKKLYDVDPAVMETWDLYNITADINGTVPVRPLKILTLGHSLSLDAAHMLNLVAAAEGYDQEFIIGTLYHSGCKLPQHVEYLQTDATEYGLYISSTLTPDKPPVKEDGVTMKYGIEYTDWDIIIMQAGVFEIARESSYTSGNIQIIQNYVNEHKTNPDAIFAWNCPWVPPIDDTLRSKYPYSPNSYITGYDAFNQDRLVMYGATTELLAKYIVTDSSFVYLIPSCTAIENANSSYLEEKDLYRDYVHMSDLGRVITSYTWYCTLMGIDHLDEVKLDAIPVAFFKSTTGTEDRVLTEAEKLIILESVNNALANPLEMTQSQYTTAP